MSTLSRRALVAAACLGGALTLSGCGGIAPASAPAGSAPAAGSAPIESAPAADPTAEEALMEPVTFDSGWVAEQVTEDAYPLDTTQKSCWKQLEDGKVLVTLWGSSNPRPVIANAGVSEFTLNLVLEAHDGPTTMDLNPTCFVLTAPDDEIVELTGVTLDRADGNGPQELEASQA